MIKNSNSKGRVGCLLERRKRIDLRLKIEKTRMKNRNKKKNLKKKILVGAYFLQKYAKEGKISEINEAMGKLLKKNSDRKLFESDSA